MDSVLNLLMRVVIKGEAAPKASKVVVTRETVQLPEHGAIRRYGDGHRVTSTWLILFFRRVPRSQLPQ
jgi:hypothetical protein